MSTGLYNTQRLTEAPVLCYPDFTMLFLVYNDASGSGLGAVLCQKHGNNEQLVAYASRTLTKAKRHYSTTEREFLGVVWAVKQFWVYCMAAGSYFVQPLGLAEILPGTQKSSC